jgi:hypothetical protein
MSTHDDDLLRAEKIRRDDSAESDRTVADNCDLVTLFDRCHQRRMEAGAHDI